MPRASGLQTQSLMSILQTCACSLMQLKSGLNIWILLLLMQLKRAFAKSALSCIWLRRCWGECANCQTACICFTILVAERILQRVVYQQANWCRSVFQFCVLTFCKRGVTEQGGGAPRPLQCTAYCIVLVQTTVGREVQACTRWCNNAKRGVHCKDAHGGSHAKKLWIKILTMQLMQLPSIKLSQLQGRRTVQSFVYHVWSGKRWGEVEKRTFKGKRVELGKKSAQPL